MKLCYFIGDISNTGGIERVISILTTEQIKDRNIEITIVSKFHSYSKPNYFFDDKVRIIYLTDVVITGAPNSYSRLKDHFQVVNNIGKFFEENKYDLILSQAFPNTFTLWLAGVNMKKVIAVEHTYYGYYGNMIKKIRNYVYKKCSAVVVLTEKDRELFASVLTNLFVIPNPVELSVCRHSILEDGRIITAGRLEYAKAYDVLLNVFFRVHKKFPSWKLDIYGKGSLKDSLQRQIIKLNLEGSATLRGTTDQLLNEMYSSSFYVMSSRFEGFAMVLVEAMSQGLPCISFDCPNGPSTIIEQGKNGILVENQNEEKLYDAIIELIEDRDRRLQMGYKAFNSIAKYDVRNVVAQWKELYLLCLGK